MIQKSDLTETKSVGSLKEKRCLSEEESLAYQYLNTIVEKTGVPSSLITGGILTKSEDVEFVKIFYSWLLENNLSLSREEISFFVKVDVNMIHYYIDRHYELMGNKGEMTLRYFELCQKFNFLLREGNLKARNSEKDFFDINLNITRRPLEGTLGNQDLIIQFVLDKIAEHVGVDKSMIISKTRKREAVTGRFIFFRIMRDFFPKMPLSVIGLYAGGKNHATVLNGLRNHANYIDTKDKMYFPLFNSIQKECSVCAPVGSSAFPRTVEKLVECLSRNGIPEEKIKMIEFELMKRLRTSYVFSPDETTSILGRFGIRGI